MYNTILLPVDGSKHSTRAEQTALNLAEQFDANLHVLHVVDRRKYPEPALSTMELVTDEAEDRARALIETIADDARSRGLTVETDCCHGVPYRKIEDFAADANADLIVMGRRGHTDDEKIGAVTTRVVRETDRQTLTV